LCPLLNKFVAQALNFAVETGSSGYKANADINCVPEGMSSPRTRSQNKKFIVPMEVKTWWKFEPAQPLQTIWKRCTGRDKFGTIEDKVYHTVRQMTGQVMTDKSLFGSLTTYKQLWFFKRGVCAGNDRRIYISRCYDWKKGGDPAKKRHSVLQAYAALLLHAQSRAAVSSTPGTVETQRWPKRHKRDRDEDDNDDERNGGGPAKGGKARKRLAMRGNDQRRDGDGGGGSLSRKRSVGGGGKTGRSNADAAPLQFGNIEFLD
jgi:hypothetical protein